MEFIGRAAFTRRRGNLWSAALLLPCITASNYLNLPDGAATGLLLLSLLVAIPAAGGEFVLLMQEEAGNGTQVDTRDTGGKGTPLAAFYEAYCGIVHAFAAAVYRLPWFCSYSGNPDPADFGDCSRGFRLRDCGGN
ncbi:hypothetical protein ACUH92_06235 [Dermabacteraceae bacterium CCM 9520]